MQENNLENKGTNFQNTTVKRNIVPSYLKKDEIKKENENKQKDKRGPKSKITFIIIAAIILIIVIFLVVLITNSFFKKSKISDYTKTAINYGYENLYNTKSAVGNEYITKLEALKLIVGAVYNTSNINNIYLSDYTDEQIDENIEKELWIKYLKQIGMLNEEEESLNKKVNLKEVMLYLSQAKSKLMQKSLETSKKATFSDLDIYSNDEINAIQDAVINGIIDNSTSKFSGKQHVKKEKFNEILIKFVNKYNLITLDGDKINIDPNKEPSNKNEYPYTLSSVKKDIYEIPFYHTDNEKYISPIEVFKTEKFLYANIKEVVEGYLNTILNVDYNTIDADEFQDELNTYQYYIASRTLIDEYVKYVKNNSISIKSDVKVALPVVYYDGAFYRARAVVNYNILSSNNLNNVLYFDARGNNVEYKLGENKVYLDIPLKKVAESEYMLVVPSALNRNIAGEVKSIV